MTELPPPVQRSAWSERTLALAAACQALAQVKQLARHGEVADVGMRDQLLASVLNLQATQASELYPESAQVALGLRVLLQQLGATRDKDVELTRYMVSILALERKFEKQSQASDALSKRLQQLQRQQDTFGFSADTVMAGMASAYSDVLSPLMQPIRISGNPQHLQRVGVQHQIRALLLAAIRAVFMWRMLAGKRRHFIFSRQRYVAAAHQLLKAPAASAEND